MAVLGGRGVIPSALKNPPKPTGRGLGKPKGESFKPIPLNAPLSRVTTQNMRTGGEAQIGRKQGTLKPVAPHRSFLGNVLHGAGELAGKVGGSIEHLGESALHAQMRKGESPQPILPSGKELRTAGMLGATIAAPELRAGISAARAAAVLRATEAGTGAGRAASIATLGPAAAGRVGLAYAKLGTAATAAQAAGPIGPPTGKEPFIDHWWKSITGTIASLPAGFVESFAHPVKTAEGMYDLYKDPKKAFHENPFGALLAFYPAARGVDTILGRAAKLPRGRAPIDYGEGLPGFVRNREYGKGLFGQGAQRIADRLGTTPGNMPKGIHNLRKVTGTEFASALNEAKAAMKPHEAANLTAHAPGEYQHAYLAHDGKWGVATINKGHGRVEAVNLFRHPAGPKGAAEAMGAVATHHGANALDVTFDPKDPKLVKAYERGGYKVDSTVPWDEKLAGKPAPFPGARIAYMSMKLRVKPSGLLAKQRTIKGAVGVAGHVNPSMLDMLVGGNRLAHTYETMKNHHFLRQHIGTDSEDPHNILTVGAVDGSFRTPQSLWTDVQNKIDRLKEQHPFLDHLDKEENELQTKHLEILRDAKGKLSNKDIQKSFDSAGEIGQHTRELWERANQNGIGLKDQLTARNIGALLEHGYLMGRGELAFQEQGIKHPLWQEHKAAMKETDRLRKEYDRLGVEIRAKQYPKGLKTGFHVKRLEAREALDRAVEHEHVLHRQLTDLRHNKLIDAKGVQRPGIYDMNDVRISGKEQEQFVKEHFGRELGFITERKRTERASTPNSFGSRSTFKTRTGTNRMAGSYDNTAAALRNHFDTMAHALAEKQQARMVAAKLMKGKEVGEDGETVWFQHEHEALAAAERENRDFAGKMQEPHLGKWIPRQVGPHSLADLVRPAGSSEPLDRALQQLEREGHIEQRAQNDEKGNWGIIPAKIDKGLTHWEEVERSIRHSALHQITTPWRQTGLYTSVRWPFGTTQENAIRAMFYRVSPLVTIPYGKHLSINFKTGTYITDHLEKIIHDPSYTMEQKDLAVQHRAMFGTGNFVGSQLHELQDGAELLLKNRPFLQKVADSAPNSKLWAPLRRTIGNNLAKMESNVKVGVGGKMVRNQTPLLKQFRKIDREQSAADYVDRLINNPAEAAKAARDLLDIVGNWQHLTTATRKAQAEWAPFGLWWLNSAKFVFKTLPRDHPYATGLLAAMVTATGQENKNLDNYLTGDIPVDLPILGKVNLNPVHYSPFDIAHEPGRTAQSMALPQLEGIKESLAGMTGLGQKIDNEGAAAARAGEGLVSGWLPGARLGFSIGREGGTQDVSALSPFATKPGTKHGLPFAIAKEASPVKFEKQGKKQREAEEEGTGGGASRTKLGGRVRLSGSGPRLGGRVRLSK